MNQKKHWAIIGAGNGGQAFAGYFALMGIDVAVYDVFQNKIDILNEKGGIEVKGHGRNTGFGKIAFASTDIEKVVSGAEVIWVIQPSLYHKSVAKKIAPYLNDGQIIILNPITPLGPIEFQKTLKECGCTADITLVATCTLLFACRLYKDGEVFINGQKEGVFVSAYPSSKNDYVESLTKPYIPEFNYVNSILDVSLNIFTYEYHPGPTMLFAAMIEKGIDFEFYSDFVPIQVKLVEAIDKERLALCDIYNVKTMDATEQLQYIYGCEGDLYYMLTHVDAYKGIKGPKNLDVRYIYEDVPYGLCSVQTLARIAGLPTPAIDAVIDLAYVLFGDKMDEGRTRENLGIAEDATVEDVIAMCRG